MAMLWAPFTAGFLAAVAWTVLVAGVVIIELELWQGFPYVLRRSCNRNCNRELWKANMLRVNQVNVLKYQCGCAMDATSKMRDAKILCEHEVRTGVYVDKACRYKMDEMRSKEGKFTDTHIVV